MILGLSSADGGVTDCENCRHLTVVGLHDTGPWSPSSVYSYCLVGLVAKASALRPADLGLDSCFFLGNFSRSSHSSVFKIGTPVAALPGAWHYRVGTGTVIG